MSVTPNLLSPHLPGSAGVGSSAAPIRLSTAVITASSTACRVSRQCIVSVASNRPVSNSLFAGAPPPHHRKKRQLRSQASTPRRISLLMARTARCARYRQGDAWRRVLIKAAEAGMTCAEKLRAKMSRSCRRGSRSRSQRAAFCSSLHRFVRQEVRHRALEFAHLEQPRRVPNKFEEALDERRYLVSMSAPASEERC